MPVKNMTQAEIDAATAAIIAAGGKSTDPANRLPGETATEANARITKGYKEMLAKPVLTEEQKAAGMQVKFVRTAAGGVGSYTAIVPPNYKGDKTVREFTEGIIPSNSPYIKGTTLGVQSTGKGTYTKVGDVAPISSPGAVAPVTVDKLTQEVKELAKTDFFTAIDNIVRRAKSVEDAFKIAKDLAVTLPSEFFGNRYDEATGQLTNKTLADKVQTILSQMAVIANSRKAGDYTGGSTATLLSGILGNPTQGDAQYKISRGVAKVLGDDPSTWTYKPGETFKRGDMTYMVIDPNKTTLSQEELNNIRATNQGRVNLVNPITGNIMEFDPQDGRIFGLGEGPISTMRSGGQLIEETYNIPGKSWRMNPDGTVTYLDGPNAGKTVTPTPIQNMPYYGGGSNVNMPYSGATPGTQNMGYQQNLTNPYAPGTQQAQNWQDRKSAYDLLYSEFNKYGLGSLVQPLQQLVMDNVSPSEFSIQLQNTDAYKKRFAGNQDRIAKGLRALTPAEYIGLEDQYQNVMRNYGLPASYYAKDSLGTQAGFNQFIANDVSAAELEDRIATAQKRIQYANPEVSIALKTFYPDITNGDILAYVLDPKNGLENIKRRITAAEIGGAAVSMGLTSNETDAEYLARYGVNKQMAQQGYQTIAGLLPRASQLSDIYAQQGATPYTQATAEKEVFGTPGAAEAARQRKKLVDLEQAAFGGSSGSSGGALARERAGSF